MNLKTIAKHLEINENEIQKLALRSLLKEKKQVLLKEKIEIFSRYEVTSIAELEEKIKKGKIKEHPAWEDLIVLENVTEKGKEIESNIEDNPEEGIKSFLKFVREKIIRN